jgi:hypothetical protein
MSYVSLQKVDFLYLSSSLKGLGHEMNVFEGIKIKEKN